jgi:hypothetical protein
MVLTASFALSPVTSSFLPPSSHELNGFTCPVGSTKPPRDLASATDARTTRLRCTLQRRSSCAFADRSRGFHPPCDPVSRATLPRPPHPVPNVRDDREAPLLRDGMRIVVNVIWVYREAIYFSREGWTRIRNRCPSGKSLAARERGKRCSAALFCLSTANDANDEQGDAKRRVKRLFFHQDWTAQISLMRLRANLCWGDAASGGESRRGSVPE